MPKRRGGGQDVAPCTVAWMEVVEWVDGLNRWPGKKRIAERTGLFHVSGAPIRYIGAPDIVCLLETREERGRRALYPPKRKGDS